MVASAGCCGHSSVGAGPGYPTPQDAIKGPREKLLYTVVTCVGVKTPRNDYLATIDTDPNSPTYSTVIHRTVMPVPNDELHHSGWNTCSSCFSDAGKSRKYLILPGFLTSNINIVDVSDEAAPKLYKVIEGKEVAEKTGLQVPHTTHCLADGNIMISMMGDKNGNGPGGFILIDENLQIKGRWEKEGKSGDHKYTYDFWYQPRHNVMISTEWGAPRTFLKGFNPQDVGEGLYGHQINVWNWTTHEIIKSIDLGPDGQIPLEIRFLHDPASTHAFTGVALSSTLFHIFRDDAGEWQAAKRVQIPSIEHEGWPFPVPALVTDIIVSMDDKYLFASCWLHGDVRQYDITDPYNPKLVGQVFLGGVLGKGTSVQGKKLNGGPQMLQLSLDGKRLFVSNSLFSAWDDQFYPDMAEDGGYVLQLDVNTDTGGLAINDKFFVDFGKEPGGPARPHEMRYNGGDCSSDIFI